MRAGVKPRGSQPSATSAVSFTVASPPVPSQIGMLGFICKMDVSGLARPAEPGPVYGSAISWPSC